MRKVSKPRIGAELAVVIRVRRRRRRVAAVADMVVVIEVPWTLLGTKMRKVELLLLLWGQNELFGVVDGVYSKKNCNFKFN